jgi:branched-chain amino acid transport system permease protein
VVNSPFGRVLQAIRENDFRAEALGYRTVVYRTLANCLAAAWRRWPARCCAIWLRYTGPDTTLSFAIMLDILLMVVIGGMGTLYGAVIGARAVHRRAELPAGPAQAAASGAGSGSPGAVGTAVGRPLAALARLFVLSVYYFPTGIVGRLRLASEKAGREQAARLKARHDKAAR